MAVTSEIQEQDLVILQHIETEQPPQWLVDRATRYQIGRRFMSFSPVETVKPYSELVDQEQLQHILDHESIGPIGLHGNEKPFWQSAKVLFPYSRDHIMFVPNRTYPFIENLQSDQGNSSGWNRHLNDLFSRAGRYMIDVTERNSGISKTTKLT